MKYLSKPVHYMSCQLAHKEDIWSSGRPIYTYYKHRVNSVDALTF